MTASTQMPLKMPSKCKCGAAPTTRLNEYFGDSARVFCPRCGLSATHEASMLFATYQWDKLVLGERQARQMWIQLERDLLEETQAKDRAKRDARNEARRKRRAQKKEKQ